MFVTTRATSSAPPTSAMAKQTRAGIEYVSKWGLMITLRLLPRWSAPADFMDGTTEFPFWDGV
ncbi:hypothetical protein XI05_06950 [Bradyrhizobium sp. CCBAU 11357]|nr:hypothetical protein [Bradyrhizobium sp. CCBAU 11357]